MIIFNIYSSYLFVVLFDKSLIINFFRGIFVSKKTLAALMGATALLFTVSAAFAQAKPEFVFKLAEIHPAGYPTELGDQEFARLVNERSKGRIKIDVYNGAQLGQERPTVEKVLTGDIDFARISLAPVTQFAPETNVLMLPYIYRDADHMWKVLKGPIGMDLLQAVEKAGMVGLNWLDGGARSFYNSKKEIKTLADLKGMKFRVQQSKLMMDLVKALGGSPTPIPMGDVYSSLQTKVIDGAENNWPSYVTSFSHYEVAKYYTEDQHSRIPEITVASKKTMNKLTKADQELVKKAALDAMDFQIKKWAEADIVAQKKAKDSGAKITYLTPEARAEFEKAVQPIYDDYKEYAALIKKIKDVK